jgi:hypothetical protein
MACGLDWIGLDDVWLGWMFDRTSFYYFWVQSQNTTSQLVDTEQLVALNDCYTSYEDLAFRL